MKSLLWPLLFLAFSCKHKDVTPQPSRFDGVLSFNANLSSSEPFGDYAAEYQKIYQTGVRGAQTAAPWSSLNPTGSTFDFTPVRNPYFGLKALADHGFTTIFLNIPVITVSSRSMPADIAALAFDDPLVRTRMHVLLDSIVPMLNDPVKYVSLGNEVDTYLAAHPTEWTPFKNLVEDARNYARGLKSSLQVGVTTTFAGATNTSSPEVAKLNSSMDIVVLTYYPIDGTTFIPRDPFTVTSDVASMVASALGKPVILQEWGYPSSSVLGSSEDKQAAFYANSFEVLSRQNPSNFPFVSFFKFRDWDPAYVQTLTGQTAGQPFYEFMSSLGVNKNNGSAKAAMTAIESAMK